MSAQFDLDSFWNELCDPASKYSAIGDDLVEAVAQESSALRTLDSPSPDYLCRYMDFPGLKGILSSGQLWFSDTKTLNDAVELEYGRRLINAYLNQKTTGAMKI